MMTMLNSIRYHVLFLFTTTKYNFLINYQSEQIIIIRANLDGQVDLVDKKPFKDWQWILILGVFESEKEIIIVIKSIYERDLFFDVRVIKLLHNIEEDSHEENFLVFVACVDS